MPDGGEASAIYTSPAPRPATGRLEQTLAEAPACRAILSADALRAWTVDRELRFVDLPGDSAHVGWLIPPGREARAPVLCTLGADLTNWAGDGLERFVGLYARLSRPDLIYMYLTTGSEPTKARFEGLSIRDYRLAFWPSAYRYVLPIPGDFETFLYSVGSRTRRNLRRAERAAEKAGIQFEFAQRPPPDEGAAERAEIGALTQPVAKTPLRLQTLDAFVAARERPYHASLRDAEGRLLSLVTGFFAGDACFIVYQINDGRRPDASLALTNRGWLIQSAMVLGAAELVFPNGIGGLLAHACIRQNGYEVVLERTHPLSHLRTALWARRRWAGPEHRAVRRSLGLPDNR